LTPVDDKHKNILIKLKDLGYYDIRRNLLFSKIFFGDFDRILLELKKY